jgi:hypothetical protein
MEGRSSIPSRGWDISSSPLRLDRLWGPPSLLSNGYWMFFLRGLIGCGVKLTTHFNLVPKSRMRGTIPPFPQYTFMAWYSVEAQGQFYLYLHLYQVNSNRTVGRKTYPLCSCLPIVEKLDTVATLGKLVIIGCVHQTQHGAF